MTDSKSVIGLSSLTILLSCIGYFVYGGVDGFIALLIYDIVLSIIALLGFVPVVGTIAYALIGWLWWQPKIFAFSGIYATWLTNLIFLAGFIWSLIYGLIAFIVITD